MLITDIKEIVDNYEGKETHFLLRLDNEQIHLKCDDVKQKQAWVASLNFLRKAYEGRKIIDWDDDRKSHKDGADIRLTNMIMEEHEDEFSEEIQKKLDFEKVLRCKKLKNFLDVMSKSLMKHHVMMGFIQRTSGQQIDKDVAKEASTGRKTGLLNFGGLKDILPKNLLNWKIEFFFIVCSKSFTGATNDTDDQIVSESELPPWLELDTLYTFKFEKDSDESEYFKKFPGNHFLMIEPMQDSSFKGNYHILIEMKDKVYFVGVEFCKEATRWIAALRKAKQTQEETVRSKFNTITRNIDTLALAYKKKNNEQITAFIDNDLLPLSTAVACFNESSSASNDVVKSSLKVLENSQMLLIQTLDSIQSTRPFFPDLLKLYLKNYHMAWTNAAKVMWNKYFDLFDVNF